MNIMAILALIAKGMTVIQALLQAKEVATPAIEAIVNIVKKGQSGNVTDAELDAVESLLDSLITDFNLEMD